MAAPILFKGSTLSIFQYFQISVQNRCTFREHTEFGAPHRKLVLVTTLCSPPSPGKSNPLYLQNVANSRAILSI